MSDTRNDAEQEMVSAGIASGLEDTLGSSLSGSFAPAPMKPKPAPAPSAAAEVAKAEEAEESAPLVPGMAEWKDTYDKYLEDWQAESHLTRAKAEEVRKKIEDEHAAVAKAKADDAKAQKKAEADAKKQKEREEKLKRELEQGGSSSSGSARRKIEQAREERERKVKEAWEMVKGAGEGKQDKEVVTDGRGVTDADIRAGQSHVVGQDKPEVKSTGYDPTTSKDPLPPSLQDQPPSPTLPMPSSSQTLSRHSATSQAWTEVSANTSSAEDLSPARSGSSDDGPEPQQQRKTQLPTSVPASAAPQQPGNQNRGQPPAQPPSLTLSLFTSPSTVSISKVLAIVGINIVLPFINGVMLGFGEIFAREVVRTGRSWWNAGSGLFGGRGGRGTSGVGLSGSRGF